MTSLIEAVRTIMPGRYIVAVSGGVDSMVLLHLLKELPGVEIIVAHANHGIRPDAALDAELVRQYCVSHNIKYATTDMKLGPATDEATARQHRYIFLRNCLSEYRADAIITAHHENDVIETAIINIIRGTGWRGIAPFAGDSNIVRPLLRVHKSDIVTYAKAHGIAWREDSTNANQAYLRNYVRHSIIPWLDSNIVGWRAEIVRHIRNQQVLRRTIEEEVDRLLSSYVVFDARGATSSRYIWCMLPASEAYEIFQALCRRTLGNSMMREQAVAALLFIKVAKPGKRMELTAGWQLRLMRDRFIVEPR